MDIFFFFSRYVNHLLSFLFINNKCKGKIDDILVLLELSQIVVEKNFFLLLLFDLRAVSIQASFKVD